MAMSPIHLTVAAWASVLAYISFSNRCWRALVFIAARVSGSIVGYRVSFGLGGVVGDVAVGDDVVDIGELGVAVDGLDVDDVDDDG